MSCIIKVFEITFKNKKHNLIFISSNKRKLFEFELKLRKALFYCKISVWSKIKGNVKKA